MGASGIGEWARKRVMAGVVCGVVAGSTLLMASMTPTMWGQAAGASGGDGNSAGKLRIYFADVEGGQSTLFVAPDGHSLLVDTGWPENGGRDADRIVALAKDAGVSRINAVLITHFHVDHVGGLPELLKRIPVDMLIDHGQNREPGDAATEKGWEAYQKIVASGKYKRVTVKPGDKLPVEGFDATVISADGKLIDRALPGGGEQNRFCATTEKKAADQTENARSLGFALQFGALRVLDLGDLTWDKELELMCPVNKLGHVDLLVVSHHGWYQSSSPALVDAIAPQVAIMDNGAKKGGTPSTLDIFRNAPSKPVLWQLHFSDEGGTAHNTDAARIANLQGPQDSGNYFMVTASMDGHYTVFNSRTKQTVAYDAKQQTTDGSVQGAR